MTSAETYKVLRGIRGAALAAFLCILAAGCAPGDTLGAFSGESMGTTYHIKVIGPYSEEQFKEFAAAAKEALARVDGAMSTYKPDSELSRFNAGGPEPFTLTPETAKVFACALEVSRQSGGAFDVTVGPLVDAWGFGPPGARALPEPEALEALRKRVGYEQLTLEDGTLTKSRANVHCDLSAVAKGYAVDAVAAALESAGVLRYMAEVGGEVRARGMNQDGVPWRIAIERPDPDVRESQRVVGLENIALATSGDYRNFYVDGEGVMRSHTIDPRTGRPAEHGLASASVFHESCMWADAYATALMVLGPEDGYAFAEKHNLAALLMTRDGLGGVIERATPAFKARFGD